MKRVLIRCGWLVTLDPDIGDFKHGELLFSGNRIEAVGRNLGATADETIDAGDKIVMPGLVNAHMHTWETALRGIGAEWMTADYLRHMHLNLATRYRPEDNYLGNLIGALAQIDAGVTTLVDWCHNITGIELAERAVDGLIDSGIRAVFAHGTAKPPTAEGGAVHRHPASARAHRSAAQRPPGGRRRPRHPRHGHTRSGLGQLGGGRARHPHGARARTGVVVAYTTAGGLRRARRLSAHGRGGAARAGPQSRAWHELRRGGSQADRGPRRVAHVDGAGRAASSHRRHAVAAFRAAGGLPSLGIDVEPFTTGHMFREMQAALLFARGKEIRNNALRGNSPFRQLPVRSREALSGRRSAARAPF